MSSPADSLSRARLLRDHNRHDEAVPLLLEALAQNPDFVEAHVELALTRLAIPEQRKLALENINAAVALQADDAQILAIKGYVLSRLDREKQALKFADDAIALDPSCVMAWTVKAGALGGLNRWAEGEIAAREALKLDPDDPSAANQLAIFLRMQGRLDESGLEVGGLLSRNAEDPDAHATNGWAALQRGDHKKAEEHLAEALRIDPENRYAKEGMKQAFKSRSLFYRLFLKWSFLMNRFSGGKRFAIMIGIYILYRVLSGMIGAKSSTAGLVAAGIWIGFVCWASLSPAIGNFILLKDPLARLALEPAERRSGIFVGLPFFIGVVMVIVGVVLALTVSGLIGGGFALGGLALVIACLPASRVFENASGAGQLIFGLAALLGVAASAAFVSMGFWEEGPSAFLESFAFFGFIAAALSTWLTLIPGLVKTPDWD